MNPGDRRQLLPPEKYWSGLHSLPALSVLAGPLYPASNRTDTDNGPYSAGIDTDAGFACVLGFARAEKAPARKYR